MELKINHVGNYFEQGVHVTIINNISQLLGNTSTFSRADLEKRINNSPMAKICHGSIIIDALASTEPSSPTQSMMNLATQFLSNPNKSVMLIQGDAGGGKTVFCHSLVRHVNLNQNFNYIALYIPLPLLSDIKGDIVAQGLALYGLNDVEIATILKEHKNAPFLFVFDSYDEVAAFSGVEKTNLHVRSKLWQWENMKCVFACRDTFLASIENVKNLFVPYTAEGPSYEKLTVSYLARFDDAQIEKYIDSYLEHNKETFKERGTPLNWQNKESYLNYFLHNSTLLEIIKNPFMLSVTMEILPIFIEKKALTPENASHYRFTGYELIQTFVNKHFEREMHKVTFFHGDIISNFVARCYAFCHELILFMDKHEPPLTEIRYVNEPGAHEVNQFFEDKNSDKMWAYARQAAPIILIYSENGSGSHTRFITFRHEKFKAFFHIHYKETLNNQQSTRLQDKNRFYKQQIPAKQEDLNSNLGNSRTSTTESQYGI